MGLGREWGWGPSTVDTAAVDVVVVDAARVGVGAVDVVVVDGAPWWSSTRLVLT